MLKVKTEDQMYQSFESDYLVFRGQHSTREAYFSQFTKGTAKVILFEENKVDSEFYLSEETLWTVAYFLNEDQDEKLLDQCHQSLHNLLFTE